MNLVKKLSLMFTILTCMITEFLIRAQCNGIILLRKTTLYATIPRNETFCVPNGEQVQLNCVIINPHDNFTNLTVMWYRSTTEDMSEFDEIPATSEEYRFGNFVSDSVDNLLSVINCSNELYRDTFLLTILRFTQHKNGYYWCQLSINNTLVQPSHQVQFSAGNCSITNQIYYRLANLRLSENRCAKYVATESDVDLTTAYKPPGITRLSLATQQETESNKPITYYVATESDIESSTRSSSVTQQEKESDRLIIYIAGTFSALLLIALLGVLALALSFASYVHHQRKKTKRQCGVTAELESQEYDDISTDRTQSTATEGEKHCISDIKAE